MNAIHLLRRATVSGAALTALLLAARAVEPGDLKALYVGDPGGRAQEFERFLKLNLAKVAVADRHNFKPQTADSFDVVLFDWPQSGREGDFPPKTSPLGAREAWTKPTVLLGSAGLNLAVTWKGKGGSG